jgi:pimeloyl-ACP methyl ester carboxylesterase
MTNQILMAISGALVLGIGSSSARSSTLTSTTFHTVFVDGVNVFYREAGPKNAPTLLLLHGFPSSSRMFNTLIPLLADKYHLVAPDYPGFGLSDSPPPSDYAYTFDHIANTVDHFTEALRLTRYSLYLQDYGGPVGFRLALAHPDRIHAIIIQNAVASEEAGTGMGRAQSLLERSRRLRAQSHPELPFVRHHQAASRGQEPQRGSIQS